MDRHPEEALVVEETSGKKTNGKSGGKSSGKSNVASSDAVPSPAFSPAVDTAIAEVYHYVAYVPIDCEVWQLDGLYPHPVSVGRLTILHILIKFI